MSKVLDLSCITRVYHGAGGDVHVLDAAGLTLSAGELVALIGSSGSGKSTLLHIAGLLDTPQTGHITLAGVDASEAGDGERTRLRNHYIGFIYQFHNLLSELTAEENVMMPQLIAGVSTAVAKARAQALLTRLGLVQRTRHLPSQLSGGEQQRVAIARALANKPQLILADEPTGNLDPTTSETVLELLLDVVEEEGAAALIATHNMALAKRLTRTITLREGKVVEVGV